MIREEDRVPTIGFVFRPDEPPSNLKISQPSFSFFEIGLQGINRVFIFLMAEVKIFS